MSEAFDVGLAGEKVGVLSWSWRVDGYVFAEGRECSSGVLAVGLGADGRAERVIEVRRSLRRGDGVATRPLADPSGASLRSRLPSEAKLLRRISDVRLVDEMFVAALDERKTGPEEGLGLRRGGVTAPYRCGGRVSASVVGPRELAVGVVCVGNNIDNLGQPQPPRANPPAAQKVSRAPIGAIILTCHSQLLKYNLLQGVNSLCADEYLLAH